MPFAQDHGSDRAFPLIQNVAHLLRSRRFMPLFATQFLGAFNDSLFKQAVVLFVTYQLFSNPAKEFQFSAIAQGLFILPFFLFSALSGQLADDHDKARLIRIIKFAEIGIMTLGGLGIYFASIPLMLAAVFAMGIHSTFFGPIKYAILPQHLKRDEVLGGTGLVEAGTYLAILGGTILAGILAPSPNVAAAATVGIAVVGFIAGRQVPPAPPAAGRIPFNWHIIHASIDLVSGTMHIRRLFLAILSISFFWAIGSVLIAIFPPLVKNYLGADERVVTTVHRGILDRDRGRLGSHQPPAQEPGFGPLRPGVGDCDGRVCPAVLFRRLVLAPRGNGDHLAPELRVSSKRCVDDRRAARRVDHRRNVRGAALCLPDDDRSEVRDRADRRRQQYRQ